MKNEVRYIVAVVTLDMNGEEKLFYLSDNNNVWLTGEFDEASEYDDSASVNKVLMLYSNSIKAELNWYSVKFVAFEVYKKSVTYEKVMSDRR